MRLAAQVQEHLDFEEPMPPGLTLSATRAHLRRQLDRNFTRFGLPGPPVASIEDHRVDVVGGAVTVRLYRPLSELDTLPVHVLLHGGGWTSGSIDELVSDAVARHRAAGADVVVAAVGYRLAPEFPFPTAIFDVIAVVRWITRRSAHLGVGAEISLAGNSAGANLAAAAVLAAPDLALAGLVLEVPALDLTGRSALAELERLDHDDSEPLLASRDLYLGDRVHEAASPLASPLFAADLSWFPPTWVLTGGLDPLVAEGEAFAQRLRSAGVAVQYQCYPGARHGSPLLTKTWPVARAWLDDTVRAVRTIHHDGLPQEGVQ